MYISAKSFCLQDLRFHPIVLNYCFFIDLSLVEIGPARSEVCGGIVFEAFTDWGANS